MRSFSELALAPEASADVLALAIAQEFRDVDAPGALAELDRLGDELGALVRRTDGDPRDVALTCAHLLGERHGFDGSRQQYDDPSNSMLDVVLATRRGLPIVLSVVYTEVARRATVPLGAVGVPGHFVVGHFGVEPPVLLDPFNRGRAFRGAVADEHLRPWRPHEIATRMLNNLVGSYHRRADLTRAIRAAKMRLELPADGSLRALHQAELRALQAKLN